MNTRMMFARTGAGMARFMYDTFCGAFCVFVFFMVAMFGLQYVNYAIGDFIPWPKKVLASVMFILFANIGVAMVVSLFRRKWKRAVGQLLLVAVAFIGWAFGGFISYCIPTRMAFEPSAAWTQERICDAAQVDYSRLVFRGGISQREEVVVFEVAGNAPIGAEFHQGSSFGDGGYIRKHFQALFDYCRMAVELPPELAISLCDSAQGVLHKIVADGKTYLVYERL